MADKELAKKVANNMLEFLIDPTVFPVKQRIYFRPEENLQNEVYENAKADAVKAYGTQRKNSDFYPVRNRSSKKEGSMDRETIIANMEALSQEFNESDPIAEGLRTMACACSRLSDEELEIRLAKAKTISCPKCGAKVLEQTGYCLHCKKKIKDMKKAAEEPIVEASEDFKDNWNKEASEAVKKTLLAEFGFDAGKKKGPGIPDGTGPSPECPLKKEEIPEKKEEVPVEAKKAEITPKDVQTAEVKEVQAAKKAEEKIEDLPPAEPLIPEPMPEPPSETATVNIKGPKEINITLGSDESISFDGVEMEAGMLSADDVVLTADEKAKLDQLFQIN